MARGTTIGILWIVTIALAASGVNAQQTTRVKDTVHNLSVSGPGAVRATQETRICIFCHTVHNSVPATPLWSRTLSTANYQIYSSTSLEADVGQPTGSSKLCLSCHDGTIALGAVGSGDPIALASGVTTIPQGPSHLGTDLSDDHPISFSYQQSAQGLAGEIRPLAQLPADIDLDEQGDLQCTSCHDPHDNTKGDFLIRSTAFGELCLTCHDPELWTGSVHAISVAPVAGAAGLIPGSEPDVASNACESCHHSHAADSPFWLLNGQEPADNCLVCHDGSVTVHNIRTEVESYSAHPVLTTSYDEVLLSDKPTCSSCHDPHATGATGGAAAQLPTALSGVAGVRVDGTAIDPIERESQLCYRCHGDSPVLAPSHITRQVDILNLRLDFSTSNPSYHPIEGPGPGSRVPSLRTGWSPSSIITCADCHNSPNAGRFGGTGPDGPHGSAYPPILGLRYDTSFGAENESRYALCYRCHDRQVILNENRSFSEHREHLEEGVPCSVCHDPHGIPAGQVSTSDHTHLINFDLSVVTPDPVTDRLEFEDRGERTGRCYLFCHGVAHSPESY